jgi:glycosyltransferase involved in cell wall biosynthesis
MPCEVYRNKVKPVAKNLKLPRDTGFRLVYASGTFSHKEDFELIEATLYEFLRKNPDCSLSILGAAQASERILAMTNVCSYPILEYNSMLEFISKHDLLLVPLVDNVFNRAKSNVKFIEAGSVAVAVLASDVGEFKASIKHKTNGFIARTPSDWTAILEQLRTQPSRLRAAGIQAQSTVQKRYTTDHCEIKPRFIYGVNKRRSMEQSKLSETAD